MFEFHVENLVSRLNKKKVTGDELKLIHKLLSVKVPGHYFSPHFRRGLWDGYRRFFNLLTGTLYTGLLYYAIRKLSEANINVETECIIIDEREKIPHHNNPISLDGIELRDYQEVMINEAVKKERGIISAPPNAGKCLSGLELVALSDGRHLPAKFLRIGDKILSLSSDFIQEEDTVLAVHSNGVKPIFRVRTRSGRELRITSNHPLLSGLCFDKLEGLNIGSLIGTVRRYAEPVNKVILPDYKLVFLAYHLSEGGYNASVSFCNTDLFILNEYKEAVESFCNTEVVEDKISGKPGCKVVHNLRVRRKEKVSWNSKLAVSRKSGAQEFLDKLDLRYKTSHTKEIPEFIFRIPNKKLALFLNRYFCGDGEYGITKDRCYVSVGSASRKLTEQLSQLLLRFGVIGKISRKIVKKKFESWCWTSIGYDSVYNFIKQVDIASKQDSKNKILDFLTRKRRRLGRANFDILPITWEELEQELGNLRPYYKYDKIYKKRTLSRYSGKKFVGRSNIIKNLVSEYVYWDPILEIEELPQEETFNITTSKNHNFIVNGIYTHNTEVACGIIQVLGLPANFFTHRLTLLRQTKERFEKRLGIEVGIIGGGEEDIKEVNVLSVASVVRKLDEPHIKELLKNTPVIISDECHHITAKTWEKCLKLCEGAYYRYGLSATPLLRDEISNLVVRGLTGDEIVGITNKELIEAGISALPTVYLLNVREPKIPAHYTFDQAYDTGILRNDYRNRLIVNSAKHFLAKDKSVFILVWRIEHGEILLDQLQKEGIEVEFISGRGTNTGQVQDVLNRFSRKELKCVVSSTISDEGLDVPALDVLIMGVGFKAPLKTIQRVGRGLRKKTVGENVVTIVDFVDWHSKKYLYKHSIDRAREYVNMGIRIFEVMDNEWKVIEER